MSSPYAFSSVNRLQAFGLGIFFVFVRADRIKLCADIRAKATNPLIFALTKTEYKQQDKDTKRYSITVTH